MFLSLRRFQINRSSTEIIAVITKRASARCVNLFVQQKAIRFDQEDEIFEVEVGAVVLATGFDVLNRPSFRSMVMANIRM